jgi:hypothetical protein
MAMNMDDAAERGYVQCKCGRIYARREVDGGKDDSCQFRYCDTLASAMMPVSDAEASQVVPVGATILVLTAPKRGG